MKLATISTTRPAQVNAAKAVSRDSLWNQVQPTSKMFLLLRPWKQRRLEEYLRKKMMPLFPTTVISKNDAFCKCSYFDTDPILHCLDWVPEHPKRSLSRAKSGSVSISSVGTSTLSLKNHYFWTTGNQFQFFSHLQLLGGSRVKSSQIKVVPNGPTDMTP